MHENIGGKIKEVSKFMVVMGVIASIIVGFYIIIATEGESILLGVLVMALGSFMSWILELLMKGFGELIENSAIIAGKIEATTVDDFQDAESSSEDDSQVVE